jgi:surface protein
MFYRAIAFNQDIGNWNIGKVTTMNYTFFMAVKGICFIKHRWHFSHIAHIPTTNVLVKGGR